MNGEVSTMTQLILAQHAGESSNALHASLGAPIIVAAGFIVLVIFVLAIFVGLFKHFFVKDDQ